MRRTFSVLFGGRMRYILIASFALVAILAGGLTTLVTARVINDYLAGAQTGRIDRDLNLANGFIQQKLNEVLSTSQFIALDEQSNLSFRDAMLGNGQAILRMDRVINRALSTTLLDGKRLVLVLDAQGDVLTGRILFSGNSSSLPFKSNNWFRVPAVAEALLSNLPSAGVDVIPAGLLSQSGLNQQLMVQWPEPAQELSEPVEIPITSDGLALLAVYPLRDNFSQVMGAVLTGYIFNNDFTLVDYSKSVAGIDAMTLFLQDVRVSTNILNESDGRAVGTSASKDVTHTVLDQGQDFIGRSNAAGNWYIGRYEPLKDVHGKIIGMLYVGVHELVFRNLLDTFFARLAIITLVCVIIAGVSAIPIARMISGPITDLVEANRHLAQGDKNVRVETRGEGELALLGNSFNNMVAALRDSERELLRQEKLASMGQMAAGVAHEINNPLGTILLYSDMLHKDLPEEDPRRDDLKMIISETNRCKTIVANLLNFAHQQEISLQDTDLHGLIDQVITKLANQPRYEGITFVKQFDPKPPILQADPAQLEQVFTNLFNNSADAMENNGVITVSTGLDAITSVEIRVADTGCGIPQENMGKLFAPFFTTKPADRGTGLGLSIVHGIIRAHHGQVRIQSRVGQGTIVIITLPGHPAGVHRPRVFHPTDIA
jgi:two-component system, NtrC family, sensor kinase